MYYSIIPSDEWSREPGFQPFEEAYSCREIQDYLRDVKLTSSCEHDPELKVDCTRLEEVALPLGPNMAAHVGWALDLETIGVPYPERVIIFLTTENQGFDASLSRRLSRRDLL
jgi:hypothetical protein